MRHLNPCTTTEPACPRACALQQGKPQERAAHAQLERGPRSPQLERASIQQWGPSAAKDKLHSKEKESSVVFKPSTQGKKIHKLKPAGKQIKYLRKQSLAEKHRLGPAPCGSVGHLLSSHIEEASPGVSSDAFYK